jgi:hypothetical protein
VQDFTVYKLLYLMTPVSKVDRAGIISIPIFQIKKPSFQDGKEFAQAHSLERYGKDSKAEPLNPNPSSPQSRSAVAGYRSQGSFS